MASIVDYWTPCSLVHNGFLLQHLLASYLWCTFSDGLQNKCLYHIRLSHLTLCSLCKLALSLQKHFNSACHVQDQSLRFVMRKRVPAWCCLLLSRKLCPARKSGLWCCKQGSRWKRKICMCKVFRREAEARSI